MGFAIAYLIRPSHVPSPAIPVKSPNSNAYSSAVLVTRDGSVVQSPQITPPVYPSRDPDYPLRGQTSGFQQVGVLVLSESGKDDPILLPLFGRKLPSRDRWEYYCASDKFHMMRLPVKFGNRDCQNEDIGCDEITNGQLVSVPDYGAKEFTARMYKYNTYTYNPDNI